MKFRLRAPLESREDGLLPRNLAVGTVSKQFFILAEQTGLIEKQVKDIFQLLTSATDKVETLIMTSFLDESTKRNYLQGYQTRIKKLTL